ncbi:MAG: hypothetical protein JXQ71_02915 [Verrucomicrobia bacterium]|nr:hypothetical protein [Verrucomicrobiota bacterium]
MKPPAPRIVFGQPSWRIASSTVEAFVTRTGAHVAPVVFDRRGRRIEPFAIAPWWNEPQAPGTPPLIGLLRGDFFCLPFGGNTTPYGRERHPLHGETANRPWTCAGLDRHGATTTLRLRMSMRTRPARVERHLSLVDGHDAVYCRTVVSDGSGPMSCGHHAMLRFPDSPNSGVLTTSPFQYGLVPPQPVEHPEARGYCLLKAGTRFTRLDRVATVTGTPADLSRYPARRGFEDLALLVGRPRAPFGWTAVTFPQEGYVWFALKDARVLRHTLLWMSNGGRHYPPWNGRHVNVLGLEEVTAYFHYGLAESARANPLRAAGQPTCLTLHRRRPLVVHYVMSVAPIPRSFDRVRDIRPADTPAAVVLQSARGPRVTVPLAWSFLAGNPLEPN